MNFQKLKESFLELHGKEPDFYIASPSKLNLIGSDAEFPTISVAKSTLNVSLAVGFSDQLQISNVDSELESLFWSTFENIDGSVNVSVVVEFHDKIDKVAFINAIELAAFHVNGISLRSEEITNPILVITNSIPTNNNQETTLNDNLKLIEMRLAAAVLSQQLELPIDSKVPSFKQVYFKLFNNLSIENVDEMIQVIKIHLHKQDYSLDEIANILEISTLQLSLNYIAPILVRAEGFALYDRTMHIFQEVRRSLKFQTILNTTTDERELGLMLNESHKSCRELFLNGSSELEELLAITK